MTTRISQVSPRLALKKERLSPFRAKMNHFGLLFRIQYIWFDFFWQTTINWVHTFNHKSQLKLSTFQPKPAVTLSPDIPVSLGLFLWRKAELSLLRRHTTKGHFGLVPKLKLTKHQKPVYSCLFKAAPELSNYYQSFSCHSTEPCFFILHQLMA